MSDKNTTIQQLKDLVEKFRTDRSWGKHHSAKNLAVSIAIEAAELLEKFQWDDYRVKEDKKEIKRELADIVIYCLYFALSNKIDISKSVREKIDYISKKYPTQIFNKNKDDLKDYWKIKQGYRKKK